MTHDPLPPILPMIEDFLAKSGMGATYFGKVSCGNSEIVRRLREGGGCTIKTYEAIRDYLAKQEAAE